MTCQVNNSISLPLTYDYSWQYIFKGTFQFLSSLVYNMGSILKLSFLNMCVEEWGFCLQ